MKRWVFLIFALALGLALNCGKTAATVERAGRVPDVKTDVKPYMCVICADGSSFTDSHCDIPHCSEHGGIDYCFDTRIEKSKRRHGAKFSCNAM